MGSIAIYERDDLMHGLLSEWLTGAGYVVRDSATPVDAALPVDLVIASISLPKVETEILLSGVQSVHPGTPIIALSSGARSGLSSNGATARALGVQRILAKPLTRKELLAAVEALVGPSSHRS
jgi:DNA-binding response OmpR family regulator